MAMLVETVLLVSSPRAAERWPLRDFAQSYRVAGALPLPNLHAEHSRIEALKADDAQLSMKESALGLVPDLTGTQPLVEHVCVDLRGGEIGVLREDLAVERGQRHVIVSQRIRRVSGEEALGWQVELGLVGNRLAHVAVNELVRPPQTSTKICQLVRAQ